MIPIWENTTVARLCIRELQIRLRRPRASQKQVCIQRNCDSRAQSDQPTAARARVAPARPDRCPLVFDVPICECVWFRTVAWCHLLYWLQHQPHILKYAAPDPIAAPARLFLPHSVKPSLGCQLGVPINHAGIGQKLKISNDRVLENTPEPWTCKEHKFRSY